MTKTLINPTQLEIEQAKVTELDEINKKVQKDNSTLKHINQKLILENTWLYEIIETARCDWNKHGTDKAIINLVLAIKDKKWK